MDGKVGRKIFKVLRILEDQSRDMIPVAIPCRVFHEAIDFIFGQAKDLAELAQHIATLESYMRAEQAHMVAAIALKQVVVDGIAVIPGEINIKIRRGCALFIQETF